MDHGQALGGVMDEDDEEQRAAIAWGQDPEAEEPPAFDTLATTGLSAGGARQPVSRQARVCRVARCAKGLAVENTIDLIVPWEFSI